MTGAPRILVVDDDRHVRGMLKLVLEVEGYTVDLAADGPDALRVLEARPPDAAVLDVMMPGLDGHAVLRHIRTGPNAALPVVMVTAADSDEQVWRAWSEGVDYFLPKPFDPDELIRFLSFLFKAQLLRARGA